MAIWQFSFKIVPREKVIENYKFFPVRINDSEFDRINDWKDYIIIEESLDKLSNFLVPSKSWSNEIKQFGDIEKTCIEVVYDDGVLEEVSVRLDLRTLDNFLLKSIIDFIESNNGMILINERNILQNPSIENIIEEIKKSKAYTFIKDPKVFFKSLINKKKQ